VGLREYKGEKRRPTNRRSSQSSIPLLLTTVSNIFPCDKHSLIFVKWMSLWMFCFWFSIDSSFADTHDCCRTNVQSSAIENGKPYCRNKYPLVLSTCRTEGRHHASGAFRNHWLSTVYGALSVLDFSSKQGARCRSGTTDMITDEIEKKSCLVVPEEFHHLGKSSTNSARDLIT